MFGDEEMDFSGKAFGAAHLGEAAGIVAVGEADIGSDQAWSVQLPKGGVGAPQLAALAQTLAPLKVVTAGEPALYAGSDFGPLQVNGGVPGFSIRQDASRYFDIHHSADDTLDKVDPEHLRQVVATWAPLVWLIADSDIDFRALATAAPAPAAPR